MADFRGAIATDPLYSSQEIARGLAQNKKIGKNEGDRRFRFFRTVAVSKRSPRQTEALANSPI
ncbi:hypothetical protein JJD41_01360 [Oxynema sp. CENA135]|nr:hypothetical protein [Oxynema sp. CENA135]